MSDTIITHVKAARSQSTSAALDVLFGEVDQLLSDGNFDRVNEMLKTADFELGVTLAIGMLTITFQSKNNLSERAPFLERLRAQAERYGRPADLLHGLE